MLIIVYTFLKRVFEIVCKFARTCKRGTLFHILKYTKRLLSCFQIVSQLDDIKVEVCFKKLKLLGKRMRAFSPYS